MGKLPLSKLPPKSVAVCGVASLFVHVTVPPTLRCTTFGENAKLSILTEAAKTGVFPEDVGFIELLELLPPPQPVSMNKLHATTKANEMIFVFIKCVFCINIYNRHALIRKKVAFGLRKFRYS